MKYEPYKIDNFEENEKVVFLKQNFSLPTGTRDFGSALYFLY
jgi:hypothetical protein